MCETRGGGEGLWSRLPATGLMFYIVIRALYGSLIVQRGEGMRGRGDSNDRSATSRSAQTAQTTCKICTHPTF